VRTLLLIRHGETAWNAARRLQGAVDLPLSPAGRAQARALAQMVAALAPVAAVASDLARARETAALLGFPGARLDRRWRESDLGRWTGRSPAELPPGHHRQWRAGRRTPPGGESWEALGARVGAALADLREGGRGTVLVVTHGGPIRRALALMVGLDPDRIVPPRTGSLTVVDLEGGARLRAYNLTPGGPPVR
jgi:glucosyl-3-phosphoglycerate phosphatase